MTEHLVLSTLPKTWILDLDGTICKHNGYKTDGTDTLLPGAKEYLDALPAEDRIIILTSRTEEYREKTLRFLEDAGVRYDDILFGMPYGERIVVNDSKPSGLKTAYAVCIERDSFSLPKVERTEESRHVDSAGRTVKVPLGIDNTKAVLKDNPLFVKGREIYEAISKQRPEGYEVVISPKHIGDTIWLCSLIRAYKEQHGNPKVLMVVQESHKVLVDCFSDVDLIITLSSWHMKALEIYIEQNGYWNHDHILYGHAPFMFIVENNVLQYVQTPTTMLSGSRRYLDLTEDAMPVRMKLPVYEESAELRDMFGNAVLLMPGAISWNTGSVPASFWEKLAKTFQDKGIQVYTNYNNLEHEFVVEGTEPLSSTFSELMILTNYFKGFIGLRSGICDLVAESDAPLVCIYPRTTMETGLTVTAETLLLDDVCGLGRTENIWNYQYNPPQEEELIRRILDHLI